MNRLILLKETGISALSLLLFSSPAWSSETSVESTSLALNPQATLTFGSTSNAALLNTATQGTFVRVHPSITSEFNPSDSFFAAVTLSGSMKRFQDSSVGAIANESGADLKSDLAWSVGESWEFGSNLSLSYFENHTPTVGTASVEAQLQSYLQPELRLYAAWLGQFWSFELGIADTGRNHSTTTSDIQGNLFKNNYNEYRVDGKLTYRWSKDLRFHIKSTLEHRSYSQRMAEFSDGLPAFPAASNPLLTTTASDNEAQLKSRIGTAQLTTGIGLRMEKDEVFGARDSTKLKFRERVSLPIFGTLHFEPEASFSRQTFSTFRSDPINDPRNSEARVDWDFQLKAPLTWALNKSITLQGQYVFNQKRSNYTIQSYSENIVESGIVMQF